MIGLSGSDLLVGSRGRGVINTAENSQNPGEDTVDGDSGNDFIFAQDGFGDTTGCGEDFDTVFFDVGPGTVVNCEEETPEGLVRGRHGRRQRKRRRRLRSVASGQNNRRPATIESGASCPGFLRAGEATAACYENEIYIATTTRVRTTHSIISSLKGLRS